MRAVLPARSLKAALATVSRTPVAEVVALLALMKSASPAVSVSLKEVAVAFSAVAETDALPARPERPVAPEPAHETGVVAPSSSDNCNASDESTIRMGEPAVVTARNEIVGAVKS